MAKKKTITCLLKTTVVTTTLVAGTYILASFGQGSPIPVLSHYVLKVTDGDSFTATEKEGVRLALLNAPEKGRCGYEASKKALEKLVLNRPVIVRAYFNDSYGRLVSLVYTSEGLVNEKLVRDGYAYYNQREPLPPEVRKSLLIASDEARKTNGGFMAPCVLRLKIGKT